MTSLVVIVVLFVLLNALVIWAAIKAGARQDEQLDRASRPRS